MKDILVCFFGITVCLFITEFYHLYLNSTDKKHYITRVYRESQINCLCILGDKLYFH